MKLKFGFSLFLLIAGFVTTNAQGGGFRRSVEERVQIVHAKMDSAFKLDADKLVKVDTVFANYYRQQNKLREELSSGGDRPDFQVMREKIQPSKQEIRS